ncbi:MAG TPA: iron ABC transporter permease [Pseudonocardiaceae bacterium]|nr:iron ABC transporter permease [Pseudonocardiaceae bacterium]
MTVLTHVPVDPGPPASAGPARVRRPRDRGRPPSVLLVPAGLAAAVALLPLVYLAVRATERGLGAALEVLGQDRTVALVARSLTLAGAVTLVCLVLGVSLAGLIVRTTLPGRRVWGVLVALPLAVPSYVAAFAWLSLLPGFGGFLGSTLVLSVCCYPYVYLPVVAALARIDPAHEEVSRSLGAGPVRTFVTVTVRQVRPAAAGGALLVALYVLADFGAVALLRYDVFTRVIYTSYRSSFDLTPAAVLGCVLVALTVLIVWGESRTRGRAGHARLGGGAARHRPRTRLGGWTPLALACCGLVVTLALGVPLGALGYWLVQGSSAGLDLAEVSAAAVRTLGVSALGAAAAVLLALPVGVIAARYRGRVAQLLEQAAYAGHALPGIVVALSLVFLAVRYARPIYQELPVLVLAYAVLFLPAAVAAVRASVAQSPPQLEEVARSLGRTPTGVLRSVTVPLAGPGLAAGAALVFLTCMKELPATLMLRPTGMETLASELWGRTEVGAYAAAAPYAAALLLVAALPTALLGRRWGATASGRGEGPES